MCHPREGASRVNLGASEKRVLVLLDPRLHGGDNVAINEVGGFASTSFPRRRESSKEIFIR